MTTWGWELQLDMFGCDNNKLKDASFISDFKRKVIPAIDMTAYGDIHLAHFATHSHEAAGYSSFQFIETSSITGHYAENLGQAYLNVFSCKPFTPQIVINMACEMFDAQSYTPRFGPRGATAEGEYKFVKPVFRQEEGGPLVIKALVSEMGRVA